jgi:hypothetical protein
VLIEDVDRRRVRKKGRKDGRKAGRKACTEGRKGVKKVNLVGALVGGETVRDPETARWAGALHAVNAVRTGRADGFVVAVIKVRPPGRVPAGGHFERDLRSRGAVHLAAATRLDFVRRASLGAKIALAANPFARPGFGPVSAGRA